MIGRNDSDGGLWKRYSPACTRLLSQYKTMLKLVGDAVPSIEEFMTRYKVRKPCCISATRWLSRSYVDEERRGAAAYQSRCAGYGGAFE
jgi:hypothetical protein